MCETELPPVFLLHFFIRSPFQTTKRRRYTAKENSSGQYQLAWGQSIPLPHPEIYLTGTCSSELTQMPLRRNGHRRGTCLQQHHHLSLFGKQSYPCTTFATLVVIRTYCQSMLMNRHGYWHEVQHIPKYGPGD